MAIIIVTVATIIAILVPAAESIRRLIRPLKDGVIADFEIAESMLRHFIQKTHNRRYLVRPRIVICAPSGSGEDQIATVERALGW